MASKDHETLRSKSVSTEEGQMGSLTAKHSLSASTDESQKHTTKDTTSSPRDVHGIKWFLVVISLILTTFLWGLDGTITADIQATFVREFDSIDKLAYNSVAFFLGAAACVLSWGQLYCHFNAKWIFITCIVIFEAGSALCGAAPSEDALIAGRAICGVGGSGMYVGVLTLLSMTTTEQERPSYMGYPGITWGTGTVLGPIIGGAFAQSTATWRWGFYINLCIGAVCAPIWLLLVPSKDPSPGVPWKARIQGFDFLGFVLLSGASSALLLAMSFGGLVYAWESGSMIALWVVAGILMVAFGVQQAFGLGAKQVVFPVKMMSNAKVLVVFFNETCSATGCFLPIYFIPLYSQYVRNEDPLMAGVRLLPFICLMVATVLVCGQAVSSTGKWLPWFFYGGIMVVIGGSLMAFTLDEATSAAKIYGYSILIGTGAGAYIQMPFNACQELVSDPALIPAAVGLITWAQLAAPAITLSIANSVFLNTARTAIAKVLPADAPILAILSGVGKGYLGTVSQQSRQEVTHAVVHSMRKAFILVVTAGALTLVLSPLLLRKTRGVRKGL
ncbi:putative major facilitator superfamily transporter [Teratosphaeria nubilosa]|uniref:Putative major facilitator superfamily transporter n=1 Tax=Teratosphaeria nubilosa TaxID=161662 RepID=A0A6G1KU42_9PEZI|nr:putative major facilitator superfamily transporter [Teratosphaeria nubilosa]